MQFEEAQLIKGRYLLGPVLGKGGFGTTRRATDKETDAEVAVKRLDLTEVDDWKSIELFEREANALRALDHPHVPNYIDFVPLESERVGYLVQELAPGHSLADLLAGGVDFDESACREIARQVLDVIAYLESKRIVHRDIKPANLVQSEAGHVYLVDFGSVREVANQTQGGSTVAGTFGYMAPEQLHGEASTASDLYGLGMTLVHLLTGRSPDKLEKRRLKPDFESATDVTDRFASVISGLIEPIPEDRPQSASDVLSHLNDVPVDAERTRALVTTSNPIALMIEKREQEYALKKELEAKRELESALKIKLARTKIGHAIAIEQTEHGRALSYTPSILRTPYSKTALAGATVSTIVALYLSIIGDWMTMFAICSIPLGIIGYLLVTMSENQRARMEVTPDGIAVQARGIFRRTFVSKTEDLIVTCIFPDKKEVYGTAFMQSPTSNVGLSYISPKELEEIERFCNEEGVQVRTNKSRRAL